MTGSDNGRGKNRAIALAALRAAYRTLRPFLGPASCRFQPSCSEYAFQAISRYGVLKGGRLAAGRLSRCRPFSPGGFDPVP